MATDHTTRRICLLLAVMISNCGPVNLLGTGYCTDTLTSTLTLTNANSGEVLTNYRIRTDRGDCVDLVNATNVTVENSNIGPCAGRGIAITGGSSNGIYDNYIHVETRATGCCDSHDGIFLSFTSKDVIQGNILAFAETNLQTYASDYIEIAGNFFLNPMGPFPRGEQLQTGPGSNITITDNFLLSSSDKTLGSALGTTNIAPIKYKQDDSGNRPSDNLSIYATKKVDVENNYVTGGVNAITPGAGGAQASSGCGVIVDGSNAIAPSEAVIKNNTLVNTGQCGIGIATGTNATVSDNRIINLNANGAGNTAVYIWKQYTSRCGPILLHGNIASLIRAGGYASGYWDGGGCDSVTCDGLNTNVNGCNIFDYGLHRNAYNALTPIYIKVPPPLIPPGPRHCVARSPFSTQTAKPLCPGDR